MRLIDQESMLSSVLMRGTKRLARQENSGGGPSSPRHLLENRVLTPEENAKKRFW
jgi:hypothetical protein